MSIVERAEAIATSLRVDEAGEEPGVRASTDIRDTVPPCLLVVPVPRLDYSTSSLEGSVEVTWTIVALANPPGDLQAARDLERLSGHVADVLDVTLAEPASYQIPGSEQAVPAYLITVNETATQE